MRPYRGDRFPTPEASLNRETTLRRAAAVFLEGRRLIKRNYIFYSPDLEKRREYRRKLVKGEEIFTSKRGELIREIFARQERKFSSGGQWTILETKHLRGFRANLVLCELCAQQRVEKL